MYTSQLDLPSGVEHASIVRLQARLSDAIDLEAQLKQAHWNVRGRDFIQLHQLFDSIHEKVEAFVDTLAERIATLGGVADGRIQTAASASQLDEYPLSAIAGEDHLRAVAGAIAQFGKAVRAEIERAADGGDAVTADLFTEISRSADQQLWFVEAHLVAG